MSDDSGPPAHGNPQDIGRGTLSQQPSRFWLGLILLAAAALRLWNLGGPSLWYDEVVTMRTARQPGVAALIADLLGHDATAAPLHPLVLMGWLGIFGPSDLAARGLSAACGIATVGLVYGIARDAFGRKAGLWAAWLAAVSPALVRYSQEVRMYSWLVLVACVSWRLLLKWLPGPESVPPKRAGAGLAAYALSLIALAYSHPLGLLMIAAQMPVSLAIWRARNAPLLSWGAVQAAWMLALAPWMARYLDHKPEWVVGGLPMRYLIGLPIEYVGGNGLALLACVGLILFGLIPSRGEPGRERPGASWALLAWFVVPPILLYGYSALRHPIFGPARYTLFVAPAYLILLARGLARSPVVSALLLALGGSILSGSLLLRTVYRADLKADWRAAAAFLSEQPGEPFLLVLAPHPPEENREVEVAQYYLPDRIPARDRQMPAGEVPGPIVVSVPTRDGREVVPLPPWFREWSTDEPRVVDFPGLRLYIRPAGER